MRGSTNQRWKNKTIKRKKYMLETGKYLNYNIFLGVASSSIQSKVQLFLLYNLAPTVRSGAGLEVRPPVLLLRPPPHPHQTGFVVGDLGIK